MAFLEELRQRKVVRVAIAYLVVAWLGVQVASILLPTFAAPAWVLRVVVLVLALGFPLALVLAWAIDLTPQGPRFVPGGTGWKRLLAISSVLGMLAVAWYVLGQPAWRAQDLAAQQPRQPVVERSIAVLPFLNLSGNPANEYFSDGLAETTLDMLAQVHDLKVIARTSSFAFKGKPDDVRTIGRKLDAAHLLEGSVQQAGQTVRITAQLVRTSDGVHLWSHRYDRELTDVFKIQDEIATEVVRALQVALPKAQAARVTGKRTDDVAAYKAYLRGVALLPERRVPDMREAMVHFQEAIELDPGYARAYAQGAITLGLLSNYTGGATDQERALRRRYVDTALKLDPGLGEGYAVRGALCEEAGDIACAEENYRRATELAPNFSTAWQWYGELAAVQLGQPARSLELLRRARELDPLSPVVRTEYATALAENGDRAGAMREVDAVLRDKPRSALAHATRAEFLETEGDLVGALRAYRALFEADPEAASRRPLPCDAIIDYGAFAEARACIDAVPRVDGEDLTQAARRHLAMATGDWEEALRLSIRSRRPDPWAEIVPQLALGRYEPALATMQKLDPGMFLQPEPRLTSSYASDAVLAAMALIGSGAKEQAFGLLRRNLAATAGKPILQLRTGRGWTDVQAWVLLGDLPKACAATREAVAAGLHTQLWQFDHLPQLAPLRSQPCFREAIAPARVEAARQVQAARAAGLL